MEAKITATYEADTKRWHRYKIDEGQQATGSIYYTKDCSGVPKEITVQLRTRAST